MAKQKLGTRPTTREGQEIEIGASLSSGSGRFANIKPDFYTAVIDNSEVKEFKTKNGQMRKVVPQFTLLNDNHTTINRQDFVIGYVDEDGEFYNPDPDKFPIWGGYRGAYHLLETAGCLYTDEDGDPALDVGLISELRSLVLRVRTTIVGYVKGNTALSRTVDTPEGFDTMANQAVKEITNKGRLEWSFDAGDIENIIQWFNDKHGLSGDEGLKTKNFIIGVYSVNKFEVEENDWYVDPRNAVWLTQADHDAAYKRAASATSDEGASTNAQSDW